MLGKLKRLGVGVHKGVTLNVKNGGLPFLSSVSVLPKGTDLLLIPEYCALTVNSVQDRDHCTLLPCPSDLLPLSAKGEEIDLAVSYISYYLSLHYYLEESSWFSTVVEGLFDTRVNSSQHNCNRLGGLNRDLKGQEEKLLFPHAVLAASERYVREASVSLPFQHNRKLSPHLFPGVDLLLLSNGERNVSFVEKPMNEEDVQKIVNMSWQGRTRGSPTKGNFYLIRVCRDVNPGEVLTL